MQLEIIFIIQDKSLELFFIGSITLSLTKIFKIKAFYVKIFGKSKAHWTEKNGRSETHYEGKEVFMNSRNYILGKAGGPTLKIDPGNHKYSFTCQLPNDLPYSIKLDYGEIIYFIEGVLVIPWSFNLELKKEFGIIRFEDLNIYPELRMPQNREIVKKFFTLFKESRPLQISVSIPRTGYTSGEEIHVNILYSNQSDVDIKKTAVRLVKCLIFTSQSPEKVKIEKVRLSSKLVPGVDAGRSRGIEITVQVPAVKLTSNRRFSQVVVIEYAIEVEGDADGFHSNPIVSVPITIGNVSLRLDDDEQSSALINKPPDYSSPPTFEEAMRLRGTGVYSCSIE
ncbi:arrestin domain-containing protein 3-like isoform X2 [Chironomus tepperi]|uniref:arrestin domain-containing protein 3-like isoform X2 n=1 Tax=Chironomus tepperi TaxID=113505 RepID=UPI00391F864C